MLLCFGVDVEILRPGFFFIKRNVTKYVMYVKELKNFYFAVPNGYLLLR